MSINLLMGAVEEGLIFAVVALGLLISYKILGIADLTTNGTFVLGAAASSMCVIAGHPFLALPVAILVGMCAGFVTAFLQTRLNIPSILAGIITMTALYTVNLLVQKGAPNIFFPRDKTVFSIARDIFGTRAGILAAMVIILVLLALFFVFFFGTHLGLSIRATGDNEDMVRASSINPKNTITVGLCIANGLTALSGALLSQKNTQADINIGSDIVVISLASLVIGGVFFRKNKTLFLVIGAIVGAIIYRIVFTIALRYTTDSGYLKFVSAAILAIVLAYPTISEYFKNLINKRKEIRAYENSHAYNGQRK